MDCASGRLGMIPKSGHRFSGRIMPKKHIRTGRTGVTMPTPDKQLSAEQSRQIADTIREEIARRRISRQSLAELAKLSLSTLEKVLGGRRPFTLATTVRLEQALGVSLRKTQDAPPPAGPNGNG